VIRLIFLILLLASCSTSNKHSNSKELSELHLSLGTAHLTQKNYPAALRELLEAERLDPTNSIAHNNLGLAYFVRSDFLKAKEHLKKALELKPEYADARSNLGRVYLEMGNYSLAATEFDKVTKDLLYPAPEKAFVNLGIAYFSLKDYATAEKHFVTAIELNKDYCDAYVFLGRTYFEQKSFAKAAKRLDYASQVCKKVGFDEPQYFSALAYVKLGEKEKAVARLEQIIDASPEGPYTQKSKDQLNILIKE